MRTRDSQKMHCQEIWDSCAQNKTSEISKHGLSGILGFLCAEQDVGNLNKCTFRNWGSPVRRTRRRKSQKNHFQEFWDSCAQNKTSEISTNALSGIMGLLCAEQDVGNLKKCTFRNSGTLPKFCVWSKSMKYRASLTPFFSDSLPCGFSVSGTLPKLCAVWKYEMQGVTLAIFF